MFRYEFVRGDDSECIVHQRQLGDGVWQTRWMIPSTDYRD